MVIGVLELSFSIPDSTSLKAKRQVLRSIKDRLRNEFNISLAEIDHHDKWQRSSFAIVNVGAENRFVDSQLSSVVNFLKEQRSIEILDYSIEVI